MVKAAHQGIPSPFRGVKGLTQPPTPPLDGSELTLIWQVSFLVKTKPVKYKIICFNFTLTLLQYRIWNVPIGGRNGGLG